MGQMGRLEDMYGEDAAEGAGCEENEGSEEVSAHSGPRMIRRRFYFFTVSVPSGYENGAGDKIDRK